MATVNTSFTVPCSIDKVVLAIQDTINQFGWPVLELSQSLIVAQGPKQSSFQLEVNLPRVMTKLLESGSTTTLHVSVSIVGPLLGNKKWLTGIMGKFTNAVSLRVQTSSIAINPTVAIGEGQGGPSSGGSDRLTQLSQLQSLRQSGALTEDEFESEKKRILGQP